MEYKVNPIREGTDHPFLTEVEAKALEEDNKKIKKLLKEIEKKANKGDTFGLR